MKDKPSTNKLMISGRGSWMGHCNLGCHVRWWAYIHYHYGSIQASSCVREAYKLKLCHRYPTPALILEPPIFGGTQNFGSKDNFQHCFSSGVPNLWYTYH